MYGQGLPLPSWPAPRFPLPCLPLPCLPQRPQQLLCWITCLSLPCLPPPRLLLHLLLLRSHSKKFIFRCSSGCSQSAHLSLTPVSLPKNYVAFSEAFSPNSLAWQPPSTFSRLMILPLILASFPKNYVAPSELAASLFCKIFIYQHLIKVYISAFGKSAGILQTPVI